VFDLNSYNSITQGTWEFDPRRRAGYLGDVRYFKRELLSGLTYDDKEVNNDEDNNVEADDEEADDEEAADNNEGFNDGGAAWDLEHQPRISTRRRPSNSPLTRASSTSSPSEMASPSSFTSRR
jgi:hypothetical protein